MSYHRTSKRVLVRNEIEQGMVDTDDWISDKYNIARQRELVTTLMVHTITRFIVEYIGVITDLQIPLLIIDRRGVSIMSVLFANRRVTHLRFDDAF